MLDEEQSFLQPTKRPTMLDSVTDALRNAILNGEIGLGERVNEAVFTAKLEISRATFRESLRQLEQAGLLVRIPYRGTFVREFSEEEIRDLNNLRGVLETYAADIILEKGAIQAQQLILLYDIVAQMEGIGPQEDAERTNNLHISFHRTLLSIAGNKLLFSVWNDLSQQFWVAMRVSQLSSIARGEVSNFAEAHRQVVDAIATGDAQQVRQIIREHVSHSV